MIICQLVTFYLDREQTRIFAPETLDLIEELWNNQPCKYRASRNSFGTCPKSSPSSGATRLVYAMLTAEIDLLQLAKNVRVIRQRLDGNAKIIFVVKVDGYGHGIKDVARVGVNNGIEYLGVANPQEGKELREAGLEVPILVFGPLVKDQLSMIVNFDLSPTITSADTDFISALHQESRSQHTETRVHVNVDTGMGRTGLVPEEVPTFLKQCRRFSSVEVEGIYSHLSVADSLAKEDKVYTKDQISEFRELLQKLNDQNLLPQLRHLANSAGFIQYQNELTADPLNVIRMGTLIYGYPEVEASWTKALKPIFALYSEVAEVRTLPAGSYVSYDRAYRIESSSRIAVLPVGYGDGLDRRLSNRGEVVIRGQRTPVVGKICANHTLVDVSEIERVAPGDRVELIGETITLKEVTRITGAGILEILSSFSDRKIKRIYTGGG
ncbi:MAG: alanine racemase [Candidatus Bipolaricaulota bacterium]